MKQKSKIETQTVTKGFQPVALRSTQATYDFWIKLFVEVKGQKKFSRLTTKKSNVSSIIEFDEERSLLVLDSGVQIPIKMDDLNLLEKLESFSPNKTHKFLDLTQVTGPACEPTKPVKLVESFKKASPEKVTTAPHELPLKIKAFVHRVEDMNYEECSIKGNYKLFEFWDTKLDMPRTKFGANNPMYLEMQNKDDVPFSEFGFYIEMSGDAFLEIMNVARLTGQTEIDLTEQTRLKDFDDKLQNDYSSPAKAKNSKRVMR